MVQIGAQPDLFKPRGGCGLELFAADAAQPTAAGAEPIRTRTMARLLALQGHPERALSIYDELLAVDTDPKLLAEAEELRARQLDGTLN